MLADEAHNLVNRARQMYSAEMSHASLRFLRHFAEEGYFARFGLDQIRYVPTFAESERIGKQAAADAQNGLQRMHEDHTIDGVIRQRKVIDFDQR